MTLYGILVRYNDGEQNINEAYATLKKAQERIGDKIGKNLRHNLGDYKIVDLDNNIIYEIKEIDFSPYI